MDYITTMNAINIKKITVVLARIAQSMDDLTKLKLMKVLYFIDKEHLIQYGRFVTGEHYVKMQFGPVSTDILTIIENIEGLGDECPLSPEDREYFLGHLGVGSDKYRRITCIKAPDLDELSESEIEVVDQIVARYRTTTARELVEISHHESAWLNAFDLGTLRYEDILDGVDPERKAALLSLLKEDAEYDAVLSGC